VDIWIDKSVGRLNKDERGTYLGNFNTGNQILVIFKSGHYEITNFELSNRYEMSEIELIEKYNEKKVISCVYFDGENKEFYVKRFHIETKTEGQKFLFISEHKNSNVSVVSTKNNPRISFHVLKGKSKEKIEESIVLSEFIDVKGWKALGNKLSLHSITGKIKEIENTEEEDKENAIEEVEEDIERAVLPKIEKEEDSTREEEGEKKIEEKKKEENTKYKPGDTLEFDF
ncbi:MAG: hypothetical protein R2772_10590, partial [Chitinophagales bacterium]